MYPMKRFKKGAMVLLALCMAACSAPEETTDLKLHYDREARIWVEALPIGNSRLGAMIYGGVRHEELQLNEETVWGGSPHNNVKPYNKAGLDSIRQLLFAGENLKAQELCGRYISANPSNGMPYQTVGSLHLDFSFDDEAVDYCRELDLDRAVATTRFTVGGVTYTREAFAALSDEVIMVRLTASERGALSFDARYTTPYTEGISRTIEGDMLRLDGKADDHEGVEGKVRFTALTRLLPEGGTMTAVADSLLRIEGADRVTLVISMGTNFVNYKDVSGDSYATALRPLNDLKHPFQKVMKRHIADYREQFRRVKLDLGRNAQAEKPTDVRVKEFATEFDPQLAALYFQFGRYLLISSSQPGGQAANLQGIWNYQRRAPWDGKYTSNINLEMNYWPAEITALEECHEPLIRLTKEVAETGREAAAMYGARGWTLHHNTDIWRSTGAVDGPSYGIWPTCNAWLCQDLWDKYLISGSRDYLQAIYPLMKEAAKFYFDLLVTDPATGYRVVSPSFSPENRPSVEGKRTFSVVFGTTMDNQLVSDLMHNTAFAARELNDEQPFIDSLELMAASLPPMQVGRHGQLQEWLEDWDNPNDHHRHISHLWGLFPGRQITLHSPRLMAAARQTLEHRGDPSTGWSMGWKVCCWARLLDGNRAYKLITDQLKPAIGERGEGGGTYPNLFDAHPPFQIDGNFGCTAGIAEMFVQSHSGAVHLLPALPDVWRAGTIEGIRCRGGFVVEKMSWEEGRLTSVTIRSTLGGMLRLRTSTPIAGSALAEATAPTDNPLLRLQPILEAKISPEAPAPTTSLPDYLEYDLQTERGRSYTFHAR